MTVEQARRVKLPHDGLNEEFQIMIKSAQLTDRFEIYLEVKE